MAAVNFDITYTGERDRLSSALRMFYAIPHMLIVGALGYLSGAISVIQWFIILFTGKRNRNMWDISRGVLDWQARAYTYAGLMYDTYPNFGFERANEPVTLQFEYQEEADRLTSALRILWAIPAIIILTIVGIGGYFVTIVCWFAILFTGNQPRGMFDFLLKVHRMGVRTSAYTGLLTDTYPKYE
jgi:fatty acid desaturase